MAPVLVNSFVLLLFLWLLSSDYSLVARMKSDDGTLLYYMLTYFMFNAIEAHYELLLTQAVVTAGLMFAFTAKHDVSVVFFGLPVSRSTLFSARFASGLVLIFIPHIIYLAGMLCANIQYLGGSPVILQGFAIVFLSTLAILFFIYALAALISLKVGTLAEKLALSWVSIYAAGLLPVSAVKFFAIFAHGNAIGEIDVFRPIYSDVLGFMQLYLPPRALSLTLKRFGTASGPLERFGVPLWGDRISAGWGVLVITAALGVGVSFAARAAFQKYKVENSGVRGVSPRFINAVTAAAAFLYTDYLFSATKLNLMYSELSRIPHLLIFSLCYLIILFLFRLLITRSLKKAFNKKGLRMCLFAVGLCGGLAVCVTATGGFGYSARQPATAEIAYAEITYPGAPDFIPGNGNFYADAFWVVMSEIGTPVENCVRDYSDLIFETEHDLNIVRALHQELIKDGVNWFRKGQQFRSVKQNVDDPEHDYVSLRVHVRYHLKNGNIVDRLYKSVTARAAMSMLKLDDTDAVKKRMSEATLWLSAQSGQSKLPIYIMDGVLGGSYELPLEEQGAFLSALQLDINNLAAGEKYFPGQAARAIVCLPRLVQMNGVTGQPKYTHMGEPNYLLYSTLAMLAGVEEDAVFSVPTGRPDRLITEYNNGFRYIRTNWGINSETAFLTAFDNITYKQYTNTLQFYITDGYVNTLAWLARHKSAGRAAGGATVETLAATGDIAAIYAQRFKIMTGMSVQLYFRSNLIGAKRTLLNNVKVAPDQYAHVLSTARTHYYAAEGGYRLYVDIINRDNGDIRRVELFVPESDAPGYLKNLF